MQKKILLALSTVLLCSPVQIVPKCKSCPSSSESTPRRSRPKPVTTATESEIIESAPVQTSNNRDQEFEDLAREHGSASKAFDYLLTQDKVVIDFYGERCPACVKFSPVFKQLAKKHKNILWVKIDAHAHPAITNKYNIRSLPTVIFLKKGRTVDTIIGRPSQEKVNTTIEKNL